MELALNSWVLRLVGDRAIEVFWPAANEDLLPFRHAVAQKIQNHYGKRAAVNEGYITVLIYLIDSELNVAEELERIKNLITETHSDESNNTKIWQIPIYYDQDSEDLQTVAEHAGISESEVIALQSAATYRVEFMGFLPGFPYLSGLPQALNIPRKKNPSRKVAAGSLAIAAGQCGIYPRESPAGWYVLGKCPLKIFEVGQTEAVFLGIGDAVKFFAVDQQEYDQLQKETFNRKTYRDG